MILSRRAWKMWRFLICLMLGLMSTTACGGEFNSVLKIGDAAPAWKDLPGTDGKTHSLADLAEVPVVVVIFTCNSCPVARDYEDRTIALAKKYADRVAFVAINVNRIPEDSLEKMQERATEKQFPYAYLFDESQQIAKDFGATFTPEFFVLNAERKVVYMGGMDDNSSAQLVTRKDLEPAVEAAVKGEIPSVQETLSRGCRIRYARSRPAKNSP